MFFSLVNFKNFPSLETLDSISTIFPLNIQRYIFLQNIWIYFLLPALQVHKSMSMSKKSRKKKTKSFSKADLKLFV